MKSRYKLAVVATLFVLGACGKQHEDGSTVLVKPGADEMGMVLREASYRAGHGQLTHSFIVAEAPAGTPLFSLSWPTSGATFPSDPDALLDIASVELLSKDGSTPIYTYCFGAGAHAQAATRFCTKTLIVAMKRQVARDRPGGQSKQ